MAKINLEAVQYPRKNMRVVWIVDDNGERILLCGDVVEVRDNTILVSIDESIDPVEIYTDSAYVPYILTPNNYKLYLSLSWRSHLTYEDLQKDVHYGEGTGSNENKAIRIKGWAIVDNKYVPIPWSSRTISQDIEYLSHYGTIAQVEYFNS